MAVILIVDDDRTSADAVAKLCNDAGHETVVSPHGLQALACVIEDRFDLAILNLNNTTMANVGLVGAIRSLREYAATPIVGLVPLSGVDDLPALAAAGITSIVVTPFRSHTLRDALSEVGLFEKGASRLTSD